MALAGASVVFPLTPALSLGENRCPIAGQSNDFGCSHVVRREPAERGKRTTPIRTTSDCLLLFPLPKGEGQGEGEEPVGMSTDDEFWN